MSIDSNIHIALSALTEEWIFLFIFVFNCTSLPLENYCDAPCKWASFAFKKLLQYLQWDSMFMVVIAKMMKHLP